MVSNRRRVEKMFRGFFLFWNTVADDSRVQLSYFSSKLVLRDAAQYRYQINYEFPIILRGPEGNTTENLYLFQPKSCFSFYWESKERLPTVTRNTNIGKKKRSLELVHSQSGHWRLSILQFERFHGPLRSHSRCICSTGSAWGDVRLYKLQALRFVRPPRAKSS